MHGIYDYFCMPIIIKVSLCDAVSGVLIAVFAWPETVVRESSEVNETIYSSYYKNKPTTKEWTL